MSYINFKTSWLVSTCLDFCSSLKKNCKSPAQDIFNSARICQPTIEQFVADAVHTNSTLRNDPAPPAKLEFVPSSAVTPAHHPQTNSAAQRIHTDQRPLTPVGKTAIDTYCGATLPPPPPYTTNLLYCACKCTCFGGRAACPGQYPNITKMTNK